MSINILVTGANGFLGSKLVQSLQNRADVRVKGVYRNGSHRLLKGNQKKISYVNCDLADMKETCRLVNDGRFDTIVHTAALISTRQDANYAEEALRDNLRSQMNLVGAALVSCCRRFVYCSTINIYGHDAKNKDGFNEGESPHPTNLYGWSKWSAEEFLRIQTESAKTMKSISLRFAGIHGPSRKSGVVFKMVEAALRGAPIPIHQPKSSFRFLFLDDAVESLHLSMFKDLHRQYSTYNVAGREIVTLLELADKIKTLTGSRSPILVGGDETERNQAMDIQRIERDLGYHPKGLVDNLNSVIETVGGKV